ncbi:hypothetical protein CEE37_13610 [candidate division LCP-89 bacterium B3_LCP]|uniref:Secretion system C-terminal sorting domain-containing protein n=1 Tax=candidate division LCP-89 bacterium B3_LCP TaxID=2012998 RepID=A0A532USX3_UNCL8|nr:MAG: hypothetical protein CEE37_13610 [candidate division LCP-89 bacterium B3_LCP]
MNCKIFLPLITAFLLFLPTRVEATWPTTLEENLPIEAAPDTNGTTPTALPYTNGSTLVILNRSDIPKSFQIIDKYGVVGDPQPLTDIFHYPTPDNPKVVSDGFGGAIAAWRIAWYEDSTGIWAQRIDAYGNRLWGNNGLRIFDEDLTDYNIGYDGAGGLLVSYGGDDGNIWAQRVDSTGQILWDQPYGIPVTASHYQQSMPEITHDGNGGAYLTWVDCRPPYGYDGATFIQKLDSDGNTVWSPNGIYVDFYNWVHKIIPDGQGGAIVNVGGGYAGHIVRIGPDGNTIWRREEVTNNMAAQMVKGDSDYFYIGFKDWHGNIVGQKMDIVQGNTYWPTFGSNAGALMELNDLHAFVIWDFCYKYPYFYGVFKMGDGPPDSDHWLYTQRLDSLGNRCWADSGVALCHFYGGDFYAIKSVSCAPDPYGGIVGVCVVQYGAGDMDAYAKRCSGDGTLGGPFQNKELPSMKVQLTGLSESLLQFNILEAGNVNIDLYNLLGQHVKTIHNNYQQPGTHTTNIDQSSLSSGIYFLRLHTPTSSHVTKMVVVR